LCTALLLNEIYLPMKFHVALHSFKVMLRTKKGRTDGRVDYYMPPFRSIKSFVSEIQIFKAPSMCNSMNAFEAVAQFSPGLLLCQTGRRKRLLLIKSKHFQLIPSGLVFAP